MVAIWHQGPKHRSRSHRSRSKRGTFIGRRVPGLQATFDQEIQEGGPVRQKPKQLGDAGSVWSGHSKA